MANKKGDFFKIGVLGPEKTFSDIAADWFLEHRLKLDGRKILYHSIPEIFADINKGKIDSAIVPIENNTYGTVRETIDNLFKYDSDIIYEFSVPVHHCLVAKKGAKKDLIKRIYSHQQALNQCSAFVRKNYPEAQVVAHASTALAIKSLIKSRSRDIAVISSEIAAREYDLNILSKKIEDHKNNRTKFVLIKNKKGKMPELSGKRGQIFTSIAFHFQKDSPGTLYTVFKVFNDAKINMTKIESRPTTPKCGHYIFFIDFEGSVKEKTVQDALKSVGTKVAVLKIFGSYGSEKIVT